MESLLSILIGIGLSAACGFRVFVPFLAMGVASLTGHLPLAPDFEWIGTPPAVIAFAVATGLEVFAYYIPWLDNLLDAMTTPVTLVAGTLATASVVTDLSPVLKWMVAVIAGGGVAGIIQGGSVLLRGASTVTTGGLGNFAVSSGELAGAVVTSVLAIVIPVGAAVLVLAMVVFSIRRWKRRPTRRRAA